MNKYLFGSLGLVLAFLFLAILALPDNNFRLIACDVGQGDAILAVYKTTEVLVDGGPSGSKVLDCLNKYLPFWDRELEMVILTHPEIDHFGGLIEVFRRYKVDNFLATPIGNSSPEYQALEKEVGGSAAKVITPHGGMLVRLGLMRFEVLHPKSDDSFSGITANTNLNRFSIVGILSFGSFTALLTGDIAPQEVPGILTESGVKPVDYIKIPHHGSKYGLTAEMLDGFLPKVAVISLKKGNSYGHPHEETLKLLNERNIKTLRTDELGDIEVVSDRRGWRIK